MSVSFVNPGFKNLVANRVRHQEARIASRRDEVANFRRRYLQLRNSMYVNSTVLCDMQIVDLVCAALGDHLAQHAYVRCFPARAVCNDNVRHIEYLVPSMPAG